MGKDARLIRVLVGCFLLGAIWWGTMQRLAVSKLSSELRVAMDRIEVIEGKYMKLEIYEQKLRENLAANGFAALPPMPLEGESNAFN